MSLIREAGIEKFMSSLSRLNMQNGTTGLLRMCVKDLKAKIVVVGFDFIFGKDGRETLNFWLIYAVDMGSWLMLCLLFM